MLIFFFLFSFFFFSFKKILITGIITIRVSNSLNPDQVQHSVRPDLDPNCLQRLRVRTRKIIFLFLKQNICCGYSTEPSQWDSSFEHPKHMLKILGKKIFTILRWKYLFISTYVTDRQRINHLMPNCGISSGSALFTFSNLYNFIILTSHPLKPYTIQCDTKAKVGGVYLT